MISISGPAPATKVTQITIGHLGDNEVRWLPGHLSVPPADGFFGPPMLRVAQVSEETEIPTGVTPVPGYPSVRWSLDVLNHPSY